MVIDAKQINCGSNEENVITLLKKLVAGSPKDIVGVVTPIDFDATGGEPFAVTTCTISGTSPTNNRNVFYKYGPAGFKNKLSVADYIPEELEFMLSDGTTRRFNVEWKYLYANGNEQVTSMNQRQLSWSTTPNKGTGAILFREESADDERHTLLSSEHTEKAYVQLYASVKELPSGITDTYSMTNNLPCKLHVMAQTV